MSTANRFVYAGVVYGALGMVLGIRMGATENFAMAPVHAHINLLGWVGMAVSGLIYRGYPKAVENGYAGIHFWLANIGLLAMMRSLALLRPPPQSLVPVVATAEFLTLGRCCCGSTCGRVPATEATPTRRKAEAPPGGAFPLPMGSLRTAAGGRFPFAARTPQS
jgi:hypothetical protein